MKLGIVLEGGAMRGIYTAGVLDVFLEKGLGADIVIGVSAGGIHGCSYVSQQKGRSIRYYMRYYNDKRFMSLYSLFTTGDIVGKQFCYYDIPQSLDIFDHQAFEDSRTQFYVVCSNLQTGQAEYILCPTLRGEQMEYLCASASMPFVSRIVEIGDKKLLDGGVCDPIPIEKAMRDLDCDRWICVLTRTDGYRKKASSHRFAGIKYKRYPAFVKALQQRGEHYNATLNQIAALEQQGKILVIRPSKDLQVHRMERDSQKLLAQYNLGYADAQAAWPALESYLAGNQNG